MELNGIVQSLDNTSILVTGSTGFLSKTNNTNLAIVFVEKLLRVQPNMKQLFLLLRPADASSATQRLRNDVTGKEVFRVLRKKHGLGFDSFISEKVTPVFGDISLENLGIKDSALRKKIHKEVQIVANFTATTNLDERYDVALDVNTMGAKHVFDLAEKCENLEMILQKSTAYIHTGETPGVILEKPFDICQTMKETSKILDIDEERRLVRDRLNELKAAQASKKQETAAMKELGAERAKLYGWQNTYAITKAMGEMIISRSLKRNIPVEIARPTIVSSTYREPFPGWIEGVKTFDPFVIYSGRGKLPCLLGNHESFLDIIPGDMVVNAVIVAMVNHTKSNNRSVSGVDEEDENHNYRYIYHLGSSANREKMNIIKVVKYACEYFCKNPLMDKHGNVVDIVKTVFFPTMASFRQHINDNYVLPKKEGKVSVAKRLVEFYEHYLLFKKI
ncbi:probable fatty acyl-CoA reductase 5 [Papaver somniferum]|uniref:probable fatty acyl-CoA reductase 5 n=1 Tax=Papaver somniferum TaxID=3469 RepID=UPI000E6FF21B|nr:probable fatty acyl-CoA reductase 5 [Papaver somniferum]